MVYWLEFHGYTADRPLAEHIFRLAKQRDGVFENVEIEAAIPEFKRHGSAAKVWASKTMRS